MTTMNDLIDLALKNQTALEYLSEKISIMIENNERVIKEAKKKKRVI